MTESFFDPLGLRVDAVNNIPFGYTSTTTPTSTSTSTCTSTTTTLPLPTLPPVDKATFFNINKCRSFKQPLLSDTLTPLISQICSELVLINRTGVDVEVYDGGLQDEAHSFLLLDNESATFRGLTNSCQVSANCIGGSGDIYYRTQFYSNNPSK